MELTKICTKICKDTYATITDIVSPIVSPIIPLKNAVAPYVNVIVNPIITPIVISRPKELIVDTIEYSIPFSLQTNACINYIKRRIRTAVWNKEKQSGVLSFAIDPDASWLLDRSRIEVNVVLNKINDWLRRMHSIDKNYPKKVTWMEHQPLKSKINHGDKFIVHYWWDDAQLTL